MVSWKPRMKDNASREGFCDVEWGKQIEIEETWKMPSGLSDDKISGGLSKSCWEWGSGSSSQRAKEEMADEERETQTFRSPPKRLI